MRLPMPATRWALLLCTLACLAPAESFPPARRFVPLTPAAGHDDPARLRVVATDHTTDGQRLALRAVVRNESSEPVHGVRLLLRLLATPSADSRELDSFFHTMRVGIPPGGETIVRWDVQTVYAGQPGASGFVLEAYAIRRGNTEFPPPAGWRQ